MITVANSIGRSKRSAAKSATPARPEAADVLSLFYHRARTDDAGDGNIGYPLEAHILFSAFFAFSVSSSTALTSSCAGTPLAVCALIHESHTGLAPTSANFFSSSGG